MVMVRPLLSFEGHTELPVMQTDNITEYYVTLITETDNVDALTVNGKTLRDYRPVPYKRGYVYTHVEVRKTNNIINCDCKYNFTSYGFGWYESYAY